MNSVKPRAENPVRERVGVVIVDDHPVVQMGWRFVIDSSPRFRVVGAAADVAGAMEALRSTQARILVTDISLGKESGLSLVETIKKTMPHVSSLVVSVHDEEQFAPRAYHAGAAGYVTKDSGLGDLLKALNRIADGGAYISREFRPRVVQMLREHNKERRSA